MEKYGLEFQGLEDMAGRIDKMGKSLKQTAEKALVATHSHITPNIKNAMGKHRRTGRTEDSIINNARVEWAGLVASIDVGFDINNGGLASVFLMYGTPRIKPDTKLRNAIVGASTRRAVQEIQKEIFAEALINT